MSNSSLVSYTRLSPNHSGARTHAIDRITPHCVVGQCSVETLGNIFAPTSRQSSSNYGIGADGRIGMYVAEGNRSWCSSSNANDQRAVTIECASDAYSPYAITTTVYNSLVKLCVDICKRNGKNKLIWFGDKTKTLNYTPKSNEMILTVHKWFAATACPGSDIYSKLGRLATDVTKQLSGSSTTSSAGKTLYRVQTGAFSNKTNADAMLAKVKAAGFDTMLVKVGNLCKVQVGAYSQKANAEKVKTQLKAKGFDAFVTTSAGSAVSSTAKAASTKKSPAEIAQEIFRGTCSDPRWTEWGNGVVRRSRLAAAGYNYDAVQAEVEKLF